MRTRAGPEVGGLVVEVLYVRGGRLEFFSRSGA